MPISAECLKHHHDIVSETEAQMKLHPKLKGLMSSCFTDLRNAMTMRAAIKERMESTIHSLHRFADELKRKVR